MDFPDMCFWSIKMLDLFQSKKKKKINRVFECTCLIANNQIDTIYIDLGTKAFECLL